MQFTADVISCVYRFSALRPQLLSIGIKFITCITEYVISIYMTIVSACTEF